MATPHLFSACPGIFWHSLKPPQMALLSREGGNHWPIQGPNQILLYPWYLPGLFWDPGLSPSSANSTSATLHVSPLAYADGLPVISCDGLLLFLLISTFTVLSLPKMYVYLNSPIRGGNKESWIPLCPPFSEGSINIFDCLKEGQRHWSRVKHYFIRGIPRWALCERCTPHRCTGCSRQGLRPSAKLNTNQRLGNSAVSQSVLNLMRQEFVLGKSGHHFKQIHPLFWVLNLVGTLQKSERVQVSYKCHCDPRLKTWWKVSAMSHCTQRWELPDLLVIRTHFFRNKSDKQVAPDHSHRIRMCSHGTQVLESVFEVSTI